MSFDPEQYHNIATGRVFILGCGPSLIDQLDLLPKLADEATITCNGMLLWEELPFTPTYHMTTDIPSRKLLDPLVGTKRTKRFSFQREGETPHEAFEVVPMGPDSEQVSASGMASMGEEWEDLRTARTTPLTIAQFAWWMGYREFLFLGIEQTRGYAWNVEATTSATGRSTFPLDKNAKYLLAIQRSAIKMRDQIEEAGGEIFDCTPGGFLNRTCPVKQTENSVTVKEILEYLPLESAL